VIRQGIGIADIKDGRLFWRDRKCKFKLGIKCVALGLWSNQNVYTRKSRGECSQYFGMAKTR
jgi:hypothetical protein